MRICKKCKQEKSIAEFHQYKSGKNKGHYHSSCKQCHNAGARHRMRIRRSEGKVKKPKPWTLLHSNLLSRCRNIPHYYKLGIQCLITIPEIKKLWYRDKAWLLKRPSIDRKNRLGNYTYDNCRFIELTENISRGAISRIGKKRKYDEFKEGE